jgi:hypothetical protein
MQDVTGHGLWAQIPREDCGVEERGTAAEFVVLWLVLTSVDCACWYALAHVVRLVAAYLWRIL